MAATHLPTAAAIARPSGAPSTGSRRTVQAVREPKYYSVKRHLLALIAALEPGSAVPTERDLTGRLGTSRTTIRRALSDLVAEGRLIRRQGVGTFVAEPKITWPLATYTGAPMLVLTRHSFDADGLPVEWVRSRYRGDRYTFLARLLDA